METKATTLERPRAVQMAAAVLILTPLLDIVTMQRTGIQVFSWISWVFVFLAGVSLMIRHKSSWVIGLVLCMAFVVSTGFNLVKGIGVVPPSISVAQLLDCLLVVFIVATVFSLFRYPYLDRRQNWFAPTGDRFEVSMSLLVNGLKGETTDLSYTGAKIRVADGEFKKGDSIRIQLVDVNDIQCQARVIDVYKGLLRVHFEGMSSADKSLLREWLVAQNLKRV